MFALKPLVISGREVLPLVEGGKGISVSNGESPGAWARAGGVGTFSGVNADSYDADGRLVEQLYLQRRTQKWEPWALRETADHDWRAILEAGKAIGKFSSTDWLGEVDVPSSSVLTMRDQVVPLRRQVKLFEQIPDSEAFRVDGMHDAVVANADRFAPTLIRAIDSVLRRA